MFYFDVNINYKLNNVKCNIYILYLDIVFRCCIKYIKEYGLSDFKLD